MTSENSAAKMKCLDPVTSIGPSSQVTVLDINDQTVTVAVNRAYIPRTAVQIIYDRQVIMGTIISNNRTPDGYTVQVERFRL
jgi:hypothetical protein